MTVLKFNNILCWEHGGTVLLSFKVFDPDSQFSLGILLGRFTRPFSSQGQTSWHKVNEWCEQKVDRQTQLFFYLFIFYLKRGHSTQRKLNIVDTHSRFSVRHTGIFIWKKKIKLKIWFGSVFSLRDYKYMWIYFGRYHDGKTVGK